MRMGRKMNTKIPIYWYTGVLPYAPTDLLIYWYTDALPYTPTLSQKSQHGQKTQREYFQKTKCESTTQLIHFALENGFSNQYSKSS